MILVLNSDGGSNCVSENLKNRILIFWENRKPLRRKASKMKISELMNTTRVSNFFIGTRVVSYSESLALQGFPLFINNPDAS